MFNVIRIELSRTGGSGKTGVGRQLADKYYRPETSEKWEKIKYKMSVPHTVIWWWHEPDTTQVTHDLTCTLWATRYLGGKYHYETQAMQSPGLEQQITRFLPRLFSPKTTRFDAWKDSVQRVPQDGIPYKNDWLHPQLEGACPRRLLRKPTEPKFRRKSIPRFVYNVSNEWYANKIILKTPWGLNQKAADRGGKGDTSQRFC